MHDQKDARAKTAVSDKSRNQPRGNLSKGAAQKEPAAITTTPGTNTDDHEGGKSLNALTPHQQDAALDYFVKNVRSHFVPGKNGKCLSKEDVMDAVSRDFSEWERRSSTGPVTPADTRFGRRKFDEFMQALYSAGRLKMLTRLLADQGQSLVERFGLHNATVVADSSLDRFAEAAAERLVKEIGRIGRIKSSSEDSRIFVGLVSGTTVQEAVEYACEVEDWFRQFGEHAHLFPDISILPLNVSLSDPDHLSGNATILAHKLAEKINKEISKGRTRNSKAVAVGLNAPLTLKRSALADVDATAPTREVLNFTEPCRIDSSKGAGDTHLDIVLTGVGEIPPDSQNGQDSGSIFYVLAQQNITNIYAALKEQGVVGDLAFIPLRADGQPAVLRDAEGHEIVFYSAIELPVFEEMAKRTDKAVILVARSSLEKKKVPVIRASIGGAALAGAKAVRYISHLVTDENTARGILAWFGN